MRIRSLFVGALFCALSLMPAVAFAAGPSVDASFIPFKDGIVPASGNIVFTVAASYPNNVTYRCVFRGQTIDPCTSPLAWSGLADGDIVAADITAIDQLSGVAGPTTSLSATVDAVPPVIGGLTVLQMPSAPLLTVNFSFQSDGIVFGCSFDGRPVECIPGSNTLSGDLVSGGSHDLTVSAWDEIGNRSTVTSFVWVDADGPVVTYFYAPARPVCADSTLSTQITWLAVDESNPLHFSCMLDQGVPFPCGGESASGGAGVFTWQELPNGSHALDIVGYDAFENSNLLAQVTLLVLNQRPIASAGPDQSVAVPGSTITLDGSQSYDPDGDLFDFAWSVRSLPSGSLATLSNPNSAAPSFVADVYGEYEFCLVVNETLIQPRSGVDDADLLLWTMASHPDCVVVSFLNIKPVAVAGVNQSVDLGSVVHLDGGGSSDANGQTLTYAWTFVSVPAESHAELADPTSPTPSFLPDAGGAYVLSLVVNDGLLDSEPSLVTIQVSTRAEMAVAKLRAAIDAINGLDAAAFKNSNMRNALTAKLNAVIADIDAGRFADALDKLTHDIAPKMEGCAVGGAAGKADWLVTCEAQGKIYPIVLEAISLLRNRSAGTF